MCTVSWIHQPNGYELFCNRDELLTRKAALPPQVLDICGVKAIAPLDGDFRGSWVSVNEFGLALSLLNLYGESALGIGKFTSRGLLLMELAGCQSRIQVIERIAEKLLNRFQPFTLLAIEPGQAALIVWWDGADCTIDRNGESQMPLTSSSFDSASVIAGRKEYFSRLTTSVESVSSDTLIGFHRSHEPAASAYSTCMHRTDAETVSFSRIKVGADLIEFHYHPQSPCLNGKAEIKILPRKKR